MFSAWNYNYLLGDTDESSSMVDPTPSYLHTQSPPPPFHSLFYIPEQKFLKQKKI